MPISPGGVAPGCVLAPLQGMNTPGYFSAAFFFARNYPPSRQSRDKFREALQTPLCKLVVNPVYWLDGSPLQILFDARIQRLAIDAEGFIHRLGGVIDIRIAM